MSGRAALLVSALVVAVAVPHVGRAQAPGAPGSPVAPPATVKITIITVPTQKRVFVNWGKKRLGMIAPHQPLILQRPRDSGPLDLLITCEGFVPVQTRAYTFGDTKLAVKLTPLDQKNTLLGYREEVPPPPAPDAGVPAPPPAAAPPPASPRPGCRPASPRRLQPHSQTGARVDAAFPNRLST